jgi:hypothetical protein
MEKWNGGILEKWKNRPFILIPFFHYSIIPAFQYSNPLYHPLPPSP